VYGDLSNGTLRMVALGGWYIDLPWLVEVISTALTRRSALDLGAHHLGVVQLLMERVILLSGTETAAAAAMLSREGSRYILSSNGAFTPVRSSSLSWLCSGNLSFSLLF
jgi:hypothetical protein